MKCLTQFSYLHNNNNNIINGIVSEKGKHCTTVKDEFYPIDFLRKNTTKGGKRLKHFVSRKFIITKDFIDIYYIKQ